MLRYIKPIILAGGQSERMGSCKAYIKNNKTNMLEEKIDIFMNIGFFLSL